MPAEQSFGKRSLDRHLMETNVTVRTSIGSVNAGRNGKGKSSSTAAKIQKPLIEKFPSLGQSHAVRSGMLHQQRNVSKQKDAARSSTKRSETDRNTLLGDRRVKTPALLAPSKRLPREPPTHSSFIDEDEEDAKPTGIDVKSTPDFVGSKYQRTRAGGPAGFFTPDWAVWVSKTKAELTVLMQFAYWFGETDEGKLRAKVEREDHWWVYKTYGSFGAEIHLTDGQARGAIRSLVKRDLLTTDSVREAGDLPHYRLNPVAIEVEVEKAQKKLAAYNRRKKQKCKVTK